LMVEWRARATTERQQAAEIARTIDAEINCVEPELLPRVR